MDLMFFYNQKGLGYKRQSVQNPVLFSNKIYCAACILHWFLLIVLIVDGLLNLVKFTLKPGLAPLVN